MACKHGRKSRDVDNTNADYHLKESTKAKKKEDTILGMLRNGSSATFETVRRADLRDRKLL